MSNTFLINSATAILIGILSSALFLIIISRFKPKIKISNKIACTYLKSNGQTRQLYSFKIVNKSWFYKAYDVKIKAYICESIPSQNGEDIALSEIELRKAEQWVLPRLHIQHIFQTWLLDGKRLSKRTDYAAQFSTFANIKSCLNQNKFITFEIIAKHSLTGFSIVKTKSYKHINDIKKGNFLSGNTFKIEEIILLDE